MGSDANHEGADERQSAVYDEVFGYLVCSPMIRCLKTLYLKAGKKEKKNARTKIKVWHISVIYSDYYKTQTELGST